MIHERLNKGIITVEISISYPERFLNVLWNNNIKVTNVEKLNITTIRLDVNYDCYDSIRSLCKKYKAKIKIVRKRGFLFTIMRAKKKITLIIGLIVFLGCLYFLSTYLWAIEIDTGNNVAPYEIRQELFDLGVKPGIRKSSFDVYDLEKKLEDLNSEVLWIRARIEGSTLKVLVEEKVNPPMIVEEQNEGDCLAKMDGEIKRYYISSGTSNVEVGDMVKVGDVLITAIQGNEGTEYEVPAKGIVIANTFYEKEMEVQVEGKKIEKTGRRDKDIYLDFWGKKIYLKKAINNFKYYDKIEDNSTFVKTVNYFERAEKEVDIDRNDAIKSATDKLYNSLVKTLSNDAKIKDKEVTVTNVGEGKIRIKVNFLVEQDIANNISE